MLTKVGLNPYMGVSKPLPAKAKKDSIDRNTFRGQLANVLFNRKASQNITFGWSKNVSPTEEKILDILTDSRNKTAVVAAHSRPDGDAYGSNLGISAILERMGVEVFSTIDSAPHLRFEKMPSPQKGIYANEYIQKPEHNTLENPDLGIIADTAEPSLTSDAVLNQLASAKQIIIIDHHTDNLTGPTNQEKWESELIERGAKKENILYWREERASAAEMVGGLDKEIADESKKRDIPGYNPAFYPGYRLSIAGGIIDDVGGLFTEKGNADNIKLSRLSSKKVQAPEGKFESTTRHIFNWLLNNSGVKKSKIDMTGLTRITLPDKVSTIIDEVIDGKREYKGLDIKAASEDDHFAYIHIDKRSFFYDMAKMANKLNNNNTRFQWYDIYREVKKRVEEKIVLDKDVGFIMLLNSSFGNKISGSLRSYGVNGLAGEASVPGHVMTHKLAKQVVDALNNAGLVKGGGHDNATGFLSNPNVSFKDILPIIENEYNKFVEGKDLRKVPEELKAEIASLSHKPEMLDLIA
jgi:nanoRNase/pAp phosphatase (c-di-AMP/oligoRNAs hydrolase)